MTVDTVRGCLRRSCEEIEAICEDTPVSDATEVRLMGLSEQLRYLVEGDPRDPEALARPDPDALDTIREHLVDVIAEEDEDTATRLERVRNEMLLAIAVLDDRIEKERRLPNEPK